MVPRRYARRIAQGVVDRINGAGLGIHAKRQYAKQLDYEQLATPDCTVHPMRFAVEKLSRAANTWDRVIVVTLSRRLDGDETDRVDDQNDTAELIAEMFLEADGRTLTVEGTVTASCLSVEIETHLEDDELRERSIARTELALTFQMVY